MLNFTALLIEHSYARHIYNSTEVCYKIPSPFLCLLLSSSCLNATHPVIHSPLVFHCYPVPLVSTAIPSQFLFHPTHYFSCCLPFTAPVLCLVHWPHGLLHCGPTGHSYTVAQLVTPTLWPNWSIHSVYHNFVHLALDLVLTLGMCNNSASSVLQHLCVLLACPDLDVVLAVLNLLYVFSKRSNFISRLPPKKRAHLNSYLEYLAEVCCMFVCVCVYSWCDVCVCVCSHGVGSRTCLDWLSAAAMERKL